MLGCDCSRLLHWDVERPGELDDLAMALVVTRANLFAARLVKPDLVGVVGLRFDHETSSSFASRFSNLRDASSPRFQSLIHWPGVSRSSREPSSFVSLRPSLIAVSAP